MFRKLGRFEEELGIYEEVNARYGKDTDPGVREPVAGSLANQGIVLGELGRSEEALQVFKQVDERYGKDTEPGVRESGSEWLWFNQGLVIWKMDRSEEAIVALRKAEAIFVRIRDDRRRATGQKIH